MSAVTPCKNRKQLALAAGLIVLTALAAQALPFRRVSTDGEDVLITQPQARPRIEVAFVLDTTGSMSGLIEGAKRKIWTMMNQLADGEPRPEIRVALVAYRDRGDTYVTRLSQLTTDLDAVYATLQGFQALGGGGSP
jgi:Mg-chelatase subunit ChlD